MARRSSVSEARRIACIAAFDGFHVDGSADPFHSLLEFGSVVAAIGVELEQKWIHPKECRHHEDTAVATLDISGMHDGTMACISRLPA